MIRLWPRTGLISSIVSFRQVRVNERSRQGGFRGLTGRAGLNFFAFDVIGSLAFGRPFGMVTAGKDMAPVSSSPTDPNKIENLPAIQILNRRGEYSATMGCIPPVLRPLAKRLPWFKMGLESVRKLAGIAIAAVSARLELEVSGMGAEANKDDLLSKLMKGKDENGEPMGREELTAEALTQLIAGERHLLL
jgi:benzoate 4-monooxygenase